MSDILFSYPVPAGTLVTAELVVELAYRAASEGKIGRETANHLKWQQLQEIPEDWNEDVQDIVEFFREGS
ncbi:MAG: hypothetical protein UY48_C0045G0006 [Candidatus Gottesmanbacteria bacterium GW2011_GWB1_49_7]|uniref:Uncharacterized protein n=1 Tax=Candidatus Gottesmanbacteria bacterium GW2011_GWB1_49_7 TaxID=1618448 RepID=A0A0G1VV80_9BACT|nr:MAG: hypothetical protein UY48_C0045G0006 [Candidatus Gottesmanbacteria bacterium GW2011_GWB1_49_7]